MRTSLRYSRRRVTTDTVPCGPSRHRRPHTRRRDLASLAQTSLMRKSGQDMPLTERHAIGPKSYAPITGLGADGRPRAGALRQKKRRSAFATMFTLGPMARTRIGHQSSGKSAACNCALESSRTGNARRYGKQVRKGEPVQPATGRPSFPRHGLDGP